jgi:hypothetical protein
MAPPPESRTASRTRLRSSRTSPAQDSSSRKDRKDFYDVIRRTGVDPEAFRG